MICTHAAGVVSIVSALLRVPVHEINAAIPCGLYRLERDGMGDTSQPWRIHRHCGKYDPNNADQTCDGKGCQISHLQLSTNILNGKNSKTQAWPVASCDLTEQDKAESGYSVVYPTWADNFLECSLHATWLNA